MQLLEDIAYFVKKNWILTAAAAAVVLTVACFPAATGAAIVSTIALIGSLALYLLAFAIATAIVVIGVGLVNATSIEDSENNVTLSTTNNNNLESSVKASNSPSRHSFGALFTANDEIKDDKQAVQHTVGLVNL